jgi:hypothetical protein
MIDISQFERMPCGEFEMAQRLRALSWHSTEQFLNRAVYYTGRGKSLKMIGVTIYQPHVAPCAHTHYALPLEASGHV